MRWATNVGPKIGDIRVRSWFAFFPVHIGNEVRWLERVTVREQYDGCRDYGQVWIRLQFVKNPTWIEIE